MHIRNIKIQRKHIMSLYCDEDRRGNINSISIRRVCRDNIANIHTLYNHKTFNLLLN